MRFWHKVVSTGVLATVVMLPFLTLAMCVPEDAGSMQCPPDCPMMANMISGHEGMEMALSDAQGSCCEIKGSSPAPATEWKTVVPTASSGPTVVSTPIANTSQGQITTIVNTSPPIAPNSHAPLCPFLI